MSSRFLDEVTPLVLTYNEAPNIARVLDRLAWARDIVVLDSGSNDGTREIALAHGNVRWHERPFDNHAAQWNHGLTACGIATPWVLALDADHVLTAELAAELEALAPPEGAAGFRTRFVYCIGGQPLRGTLYPPSITLFQRALGKYVQQGHTQRLELRGRAIELRGAILHDDRKPLSRWLWAQERYATLEAVQLLASPWRSLGWRSKLRRMLVVTPWLVPLWCLFAKGNLLDGRAGLAYALQRGVAEAMIALKLLERMLANPR